MFPAASGHLPPPSEVLGSRADVWICRSAAEPRRGPVVLSGACFVQAVRFDSPLALDPERTRALCVHVHCLFLQESTLVWGSTRQPHSITLSKHFVCFDSFCFCLCCSHHTEPSIRAPVPSLNRHEAFCQFNASRHQGIKTSSKQKSFTICFLFL